MENTENTIINERLIRLPEVTQLVGYRRSWIYKAISEGRFPAPYRMSSHFVAWRYSDVQRWIKETIEKLEVRNG